MSFNRDANQVCQVCRVAQMTRIREHLSGTLKARATSSLSLSLSLCFSFPWGVVMQSLGALEQYARQIKRHVTPWCQPLLYQSSVGEFLLSLSRACARTHRGGSTSSLSYREPCAGTHARDIKLANSDKSELKVNFRYFQGPVRFLADFCRQTDARRSRDSIRVARDKAMFSN